MALDATVGGSASNSYCDRATADTYFADRLYAADWTTASTGDRDKALIMATARLEQEYYEGFKATDTQLLKWPRSWVYVDGSYLASDAIPSKLIAATSEYALQFIQENVTAESELADFKRIKVGSIELEMNSSEAVQSGSIPSDVLRLLRDLRTGSSGAAIVRA